MEPDIRLQPHLGRVQDNYKPHLDMNTLSLAKVTKVHHKHGTVDLQLIKSNTSISSDESSEGKYSARVLTTSAHYDPVLASSSGNMEPMQEGQLVLLAFMDGLKSQPIILGSFHQTWETEHNVLPEYYPLEPNDSMSDKRESLKSLNVHPSQFYKRVDGIGSMEMSHPSKTFLQIDPDLHGEINDTHKGYDHIHLNEKDPYTAKTRSGRTEETSLPVNVLFLHRSHFDDEVTTWTKFFIDSSGMLRLTRDNNDGTLSFLELSDDGAISIRRQNDSAIHGEGENSSELGLAQDGTISLSRVVDGKNSMISIDGEGDIVLSHRDGASLKLTSDGIMGDGGENGKASVGITVSATQPVGESDGHLWIDISDLEEILNE